jgi:hypothetical protein
MRKTTADTKKPVIDVNSNLAEDCVVIQSDALSDRLAVDLDISKDIIDDWRDDLGIKTSFKFEGRDTKQ